MLDSTQTQSVAEKQGNLKVDIDKEWIQKLK